MFPLFGSVSFESKEVVYSIIESGLKGAFRTKNAYDILIEGSPPVMDRLELNLTDTLVDPARVPLPSGPLQCAREEPPVTTEQFRLRAAPLRVDEGTPVTVHTEADAVVWEVHLDSKGKRWLAPTRAGRGRVEVTIGRKEFEALALKHLRQAAAEHGIHVQSTSMNLSQLNRQAIGLDLELTGKARFVSGTILVSGQLHVGSDLAVHFREWRCEGRGVVGQMAAAMVRPRLSQVENRTVPLPGPLAAGFPWSEVDIDVSGPGFIRLFAAFGN